MKKAINFDKDTKEYEKYTGKNAPTAYNEIKRFLKKNGFEHRQGSGYISKESLAEWKVTAIITRMSLQLEWLKHCVKAMDVTTIGKQHSLISTVNKAQQTNTGLDVSDIEL